MFVLVYRSKPAGHVLSKGDREFYLVTRWSVLAEAKSIYLEYLGFEIVKLELVDKNT